MVVQHNLTAMNSNRMLGVTTKSQAKSTEKLSSGYKINRAADDAAGLAISEKMRRQVRGLTQASSNAQDGISAVQTAEGALTEVHDMLQRMNELAVKSANGTNSANDRSYIQSEVEALIEEIDRVSTTTKFNETYLLKGDETAGQKTIYSYKEVDVPASATIKENVDLFKADGTQVAEEDLAGEIEADENLQLFTEAPVAATSGTDYAAKDVYTLNTTLYALDGTELDASTIGGALAGTGVFTNDVHDKVGANGTDNVNGCPTTLYNADGTEAYAKGADASGLNGAQVAALYTEKPVAAVAGTDADYVKGTAYEVAAGKEVYTVDGKVDDTDATALTAAVAAGKDLFSAEVKVATKGDDYTYTEATTAKAQLYDKDGKAVDAANIEKMLNDGENLYADDKHVDGTEVNANIGDYTTNVTVNADLVLSLHVGADSTTDNKIEVAIASMSAAGIGVNGLDVSTEDAATAAIDTISEAIKQVSKQRSDLGAIQNRLEHTINNLDNVVENTTSAESQIRDTDMATEMVKYANNNILAQAGQAMLAQANQANQGVLSLLG
ncbi:MAG: flagellar hook protein [Blautia sp.]|nr:flagellar hook protein [Blautia sp.]